MRSNVGSISIVLAIVAPLLVALMVLVVNVGVLLHARTKLQIATDRGVYAGAASLAHSLNEIARKNWEIHSEFARLKRDLDDDTQTDEPQVEQQIGDARARQVFLYEEMNGINAAMLAGAVNQAVSVIAANIPGAFFEPFESVLESNVLDLSRIEDAEGSGGVYDEVVGADIVGDLVFDPESYEIQEPVRMLRYLYNTRMREVFFGGRVAVLSAVPIFPSLFGGAVTLRAAAGAQPYGGSIEEFAQVNPLGDDPPDFEARQHLYRAAFVPVHSVTAEELSALH